MNREELKELIVRVIERMVENEPGETPVVGCIYKDAPDPCDASTLYGIGEEA